MISHKNISYLLILDQVNLSYFISNTNSRETYNNNKTQVNFNVNESAKPTAQERESISHEIEPVLLLCLGKR